MNLRRVVVTGVGAVTPLGNDVPSTWEAMKNGESGAAPITLIDSSQFKTTFACEVKNFKPEEHFDRKTARRYDRYSMFAIVSAEEALRDAGIVDAEEDLTRIGVVFTSGVGGIASFEEELRNYNPELGPRFSPFFIPKLIVDMAAGHISMNHGYHGPNYATVSACASGTNAIIDAFHLIQLNKADVMVTGGAEAAVTLTGIGGFNALNALSTRNDDPNTASRPFSASRDGFVLGEGGAALILEEYEHAKARGAKIYAELVGAGLSADAYHLTASHPEGLGAKMVMRNALADANLNPEDVDYINVHGTSTPVGDVSEVLAIKDVFGEHAYELSISSTKSMTGHLLGAAGAIESIACIKAIEEGVVPPTINFTEGDEDPEIDYKLDYTFNHMKKRDIKVALSNTFGFGGHNASVIFKKVEE